MSPARVCLEKPCASKEIYYSVKRDLPGEALRLKRPFPRTLRLLDWGAHAVTAHCAEDHLPKESFT